MARLDVPHSPEFSQPPASPEELVFLYQSVANYVDPGGLLGRSPIRHPGSDLPVFSDQPIVTKTLPTHTIVEELPKAATRLKITHGDTVEMEFAKVGLMLGVSNYAHPMDGYLAFTIMRADPNDPTPADTYMFDISAETGEPKGIRHATEWHETMERILHDYTPIGEYVAPDAADPIEALLEAKAKSEDECNVPPIGMFDVMALQQIVEKLGSADTWTSAA